MLAIKHDWLAEVRKAKGHTQESLAIAAKCSHATIANIENGKRMPSVKLAKRIAEILEFDWTKFFI